MDKATLLEDEIQRVIDALQKRKDIEIEAMHNHLIKVDPVVQYPHFGAKGDAVEISRFVHDAMKLTTTPLPYVLPENSSTPLETIATSAR